MNESGLMDPDSQGLGLLGPELTPSAEKGKGPALVPWNSLQLRVGGDRLSP